MHHLRIGEVDEAAGQQAVAVVLQPSGDAQQSGGLVEHDQAVVGEEHGQRVSGRRLVDEGLHGACIRHKALEIKAKTTAIRMNGLARGHRGLQPAEDFPGLSRRRSYVSLHSLGQTLDSN
ncbi:MAG: Uncharacterised protein [Rhodospirillaceae bacterium]|nr:MAG: Uncharacterised protein [Rhodospirillaceae bacterium]